MAETFQLNELEVGECQQLFYDDQSGEIIMRQDDSKCSEWEDSFEEASIIERIDLGYASNLMRVFIFQKSGLKPPTSVGKDPTVRRRRSKPLNPSTLVGGGSVV